ncbi:TPA: hypothetical protein DD449_02290 [Candidatus Berkelbacteria bacterium]|uniref:Polymerase III subunit delta', DNA polymerase III subunit delta' protein n=1 Tax=Berkelbacteria bacterium GW2011_GWE1_39_12 TaxID=1618337 RepID=A0A0G4B3B3_9BACT|nr:MAG: polymerase III subunit delta', DNA polymerase III subunit delta' protein [Berkelbacteria bacterium GW2011_GWE1_39_12]HBO60485.1 hypothetical protein [Candidatus Berkelbacteria bacterium]
MQNMNINLTSQSIIIIGEVESEVLKANFKVSDQDFFEISDDYSIAHIKELLHFINLKPFNSERKLAVVSRIENLNTQSANALLKTLEEPPSYATIILTTLNEQKIIPTISSRCSKIRLGFKSNFEKTENYLDPDALKKMTVAKKFQWAAKVAETDETEKIILLWQEFYRERMHSGEDVLVILGRLNHAKDLLQTNISVKLVLESLTLSF